MSAMSKKKKSAVTYWVCLIIYAIALAVVVFLLLGMLGSYAREYEASQPDDVVADYIAGLKETHWNDKIKAAADELANDFQNEEMCEEIVKSNISGEIVYAETAGAGSEKSKKFNIGYVVDTDDSGGNSAQLIGTFTISQDQTKESDLGYSNGIIIPGVGITLPATNAPWVFVDESYDFSYLKSSFSEFTIPSSWTAKINGQEVGEQYVVEDGIHYDILDPYYEEYKDLPTKRSYRIENLIGEVTPEFFDAAGNPAVIDTTKDDSQYMEPCPNEVLAQLKVFADDFVEAYCDFSGTKNSNMTYPALMRFVKDPSDLKDRLDMALTDREWINTFGNSYSDKTFESAYSLGGDFYVINYSMKVSEYSTYWTVEAQDMELKIIVCKSDSNSYGFLAVATN